jgi:signal transduction histidine kinase
MLAFAVLANQASSVVTWVAALAGAACLGLPVALRRRAPAASLSVLLVAVGILAVVAPEGVVMALPPLVLVLYTVAAATGFRVAAVCLLASCAAVILTGFPDLLHPGGIAVACPALIASWALGFSFGLQRRHLRTQVELQDQIRLSQAQRARWELSEQRVQIARELHDVVAHGVSVITVQAGFAGLVMNDRDQVASSLRSIETTGRQTLAEMRSLLDVLRVTGDPGHEALSPAPSLRDLDALAARTREAGVQVAVTTRGSDVALSPVVELTAFRIIQEALTNVVKHAGHARATVDLLATPDQLIVTVRDDGAATENGPVTAGHGIVGMTERASAVGGSVRVGPLPGRGYSVVARLPVSARPTVSVELSPVQA